MIHSFYNTPKIRFHHEAPAGHRNSGPGARGHESWGVVLNLSVLDQNVVTERGWCAGQQGGSRVVIRIVDDDMPALHPLELPRWFYRGSGLRLLIGTAAQGLASGAMPGALADPIFLKDAHGFIGHGLERHRAPGGAFSWTPRSVSIPAPQPARPGSALRESSARSGARRKRPPLTIVSTAPPLPGSDPRVAGTW